MIALEKKMAESLSPLSAEEWSSLEREARIEQLMRPDLLGRTRLHDLAANAPREIAARLLSALPVGTLSSCTTKSGDSPLHWLVDDARDLIPGDVEVVAALLLAGADPHAHDSRGQSALASLRRRVDRGGAESAVAAACISAIEAHASAAAAGAAAACSAGPLAGSIDVPAFISPTAAAAGAAGGAGGAVKAPRKMLAVKLKK